MKKPLACLAALALCAACGRGSGDSLQREQQQYDVVQEGTSTAANSTITAPGEPPPAMTATNADTTSNFTLPQAGITASTQPPGTIAGTLTIPSNSGPLIGYPTAPPRPHPAPHAEHPATTPQTETTEPAASTTSTSDNAPPPSSSTNPPTTDTAPPPPPSTDSAPPPATKTGLAPQASGLGVTTTES